jgi:hypothetical protein
MTDEEIGAEVRIKAREFCRALDVAGKAGLQIEVVFSNTIISQDGHGPSKKTGWVSGTSLKRVLFV